MEKKNQIVVTIHANVVAAEFPEEDNVCVKMNVATSGDWKVISGDHTALSAFSYRGQDHRMNIDLPFETAFKTTSPFLWPRYVFTCYSKDRSGTDCLKGYGTLFLPSTPGRHVIRVRCFIPEPSSMIQRITARLRGLNAELVNPMMPAYADGRYALRVSTKGSIDVEVNVNIRTSETGYQFSTGNNEGSSKNMNSNLPNSSQQQEGEVEEQIPNLGLY